MTGNLIPISDKLAFRVQEIPALTGLSVAKARKDIRAGILKTKKVGAAQIILRADLENWLNGKGEESNGKAKGRRS